MNALTLCTAGLALLASTTASANPIPANPAPTAAPAGQLNLADEQAHLQSVSSQLRQEGATDAAMPQDAKPANGHQGHNLVNVSF